MHIYYVYILASKAYGTLYTGVTNDLIRRVDEHKRDVVEGFTSKYQVHKLVYYERHASVRDAIRREKSIKRWRRDWKINLIEHDNPRWLDLYTELMARNRRETQWPPQPSEQTG
jgi:putative endonuclease